MNNSSIIAGDMKDKSEQPTPLPAGSRRSVGEKCFEISLPALVKGRDAEGHTFEEKTEIARISSEEAVFRLKQRVLIDTPLNLTLRVPRTLILGDDLDLNVSGTVLCAAAERGVEGEQTIALRLRRSYSIASQTG